MSQLWDTIRRFNPPVKLAVHEFNPRAKAKPGRLYRWEGALFFCMDDGFALVLPDDQIMSMIKAGLLAKDVPHKERLQ